MRLFLKLLLFLYTSVIFSQEVVFESSYKDKDEVRFFVNKYSSLQKLFDNDDLYKPLLESNWLFNIQMLKNTGYKLIEDEYFTKCDICGYKRKFELEFGVVHETTKRFSTSVANIKEYIFKHDSLGYLSIWYIPLSEKNLYTGVHELTFFPVHVFSWQEKDKNYYTCKNSMLEYAKEYMVDDLIGVLDQESVFFRGLSYKEMLSCFGEPTSITNAFIVEPSLEGCCSSTFRDQLKKKYYFSFLAKWFLPYPAKKVTWKKDCYSDIVAVYDAKVENPKEAWYLQVVPYFVYDLLENLYINSDLAIE